MTSTHYHKLIAIQAEHPMATTQTISPDHSDKLQKHYELRVKTLGITGMMEAPLWSGKGGLNDFLTALNYQITPSLEDETFFQNLPKITDLKQRLVAAKQFDKQTTQEIIKAYQIILTVAHEITENKTLSEKMKTVFNNRAREILGKDIPEFNPMNELVITRNFFNEIDNQDVLNKIDRLFLQIASNNQAGEVTISHQVDSYSNSNPSAMRRVSGAIFQAQHLLARTAEALTRPAHNYFLDQITRNHPELHVARGQLNLNPQVPLRADVLKTILGFAASGQLSIQDIALDLELKIKASIKLSADIIPDDATLKTQIETATANRCFYDYFNLLHFTDIMPEILPAWEGITGQPQIHHAHAFAADTHSLEVSRMMQWLMDVTDLLNETETEPLKLNSFLIGQINNYLTKIEGLLAGRQTSETLTEQDLIKIHQLNRKIEQYLSLFDRQQTYQYVGAYLKASDAAIFDRSDTDLTPVTRAIQEIRENQADLAENGKFKQIFSIALNLNNMKKTEDQDTLNKQETALAVASIGHDIGKGKKIIGHEALSAEMIASSRLFNLMDDTQKEIIESIVAGHGVPYKYFYDFEDAVMFNTLAELIPHPKLLAWLAAADHLGLSLRPEDAMTESTKRLRLVAAIVSENTTRFKTMLGKAPTPPGDSIGTDKIVTYAKDLGSTYAKARAYSWEQVALDLKTGDAVGPEEIGVTITNNTLTVYADDKPGFAAALIQLFNDKNITIKDLSCFTTKTGKIVDIINVDQAMTITNLQELLGGVITRETDTLMLKLPLSNLPLNHTEQAHPVIFNYNSDIEIDRYINYTIISTAKTLSPAGLKGVLEYLRDTGYNLKTFQRNSSEGAILVLTGENNDEQTLDTLRKNLAKKFGPH